MNTPHTTPTTYANFTDTPVRFFSIDPFNDWDVNEIPEHEFSELADAGCKTSYDRNTVRENGIKQICLTVELPDA